MNRVCKCGGIIREANKPYWDVLPSCNCQAPEMIQQVAYTIKSNTSGTDESLSTK